MRAGVIVFTACSLLAQPPAAPRFTDYPVSTIYRGRPAAPKFDADDFYLDRFIEAVTYSSAHGPNFAGHYAIAQWSCGSDCRSMEVVDVKNGRIFREAPYGMMAIAGRFAGLSFKVNSRLLIAEGCFDNDWNDEHREPRDCGRKYFEWTGTGFKLLREIPMPVRAR